MPDDLEETTEVQLVAEIYNQASASFGSSGLSDTTVLDQTFDDADLVGQPLTIGNFVNSTSTGFLFSVVTNTYTPYLDMGDEAYPTSQDELIEGTPYQEILSNFPLSNQVLTGLFLNVTLSGPEGPASTYQRALVDRIGYAARAGLANPNIVIPSGGAPALSDFDLYTLNVQPGLQDPAPLAALDQTIIQESQGLQAELSTGVNTQADAVPLTALLRDITEIQGINYLVTSDVLTRQIAGPAQVTAYFDRPRLILTSSQLDPTSSNPNPPLTFAIDLRRDTIRAVARPGQATEAIYDFNLARGLIDNGLEGDCARDAPARPDRRSPATRPGLYHDRHLQRRAVPRNRTCHNHTRDVASVGHAPDFR